MQPVSDTKEKDSKLRMEIEQRLDAILDAEERDGQGNPLELHALIHERRRKRAHAKAKALQPELRLRGSAHHEDLAKTVREFFRAPLTADDMEAGPGAADYLVGTVADTVDAGDPEDTIFAALRVVRKVWAWNMAHLGPIEGWPKPAAETKPSADSK